MRVYVDTSALIKLLIVEPGTDIARRVWDDADSLTTSNLTPVEAAAAIQRGVRQRRLHPQDAAITFNRFVELSEQTDRVELVQRVIGVAVHFAQILVLRGYDAVHLACAVWSEADVVLAADKQLLSATDAIGLHTADARGA